MVYYEQPSDGVSTVRQVNGRLEIMVPSQKNLFVGLFLLVWLGGWTAGGVAAFNSFMGWSSPMAAKSGSFGSSFLAFWLCGWFLGECYAIYALLWMAFGSELIAIDAASIRYRWSILGIGREKNYALATVRNLRSIPSASPFSSNRYNSAPLDKGSIGFDYGRGSVALAKGIDPGEATSILDQIYSYNAALRPKKNW